MNPLSRVIGSWTSLSKSDEVSSMPYKSHRTRVFETYRAWAILLGSALTMGLSQLLKVEYTSAIGPLVIWTFYHTAGYLAERTICRAAEAKRRLDTLADRQEQAQELYERLLSKLKELGVTTENEEIEKLALFHRFRDYITGLHTEWTDRRDRSGE
jgi:hypothetical protein